MRSFLERVAGFLEVFSPIIILLFVCSAYLYPPTNENDENNTKMIQEPMKQKPVNHFSLTHKI
jgi:hypothetical protein